MIIAIVWAVPASAPTGLFAQPVQGQRGAVIDTVILDRLDLFDDSAAATNPAFELLNSLHVTTQRHVIRRELLLRAGTPYDSAQASESERNLRGLGLFQRVRVDTATVDGRLAAIVRTRDAWSIEPRVEARIASDGTLTGSLGATEKNVAGTGNRVQAWYVREADRDGLVLGAQIDRLGQSRLGLSGSLLSLSDRKAGSWALGHTFQSFSDRWSFNYTGRAVDGRVLQFQSFSPARRDTTQWTRRALINRAFVSFAPLASPAGYVRVGATFEVRREEYFLRPPPAVEPIFDSLMTIPDTVYGGFGVFVEARRSRFERLSRFNGFTEEDQDLSPLAFLQLNLAPGGWGYSETGVGVRGLVGAGTRAGRVLAKARVGANGLFTGAGLDSGRVVGVGTVALQPSDHQVTFLRVTGGIQESPPPGGEFDRGFETPPRLWGPHAFVGTRSVVATLEHRFYAIDRILDVIGLGLGAFLDYGGAWYEDQEARAGGNVGLSVFLGSPLSSRPQTSHLSAGYRFGGDLGGTGFRRWVLSLGTGIVF